ncbi:hypothetical protein IC614_01650 [Allosphingosinicella flava]|uniref:Flagellar protein FliT n=1 Tax=Allosphingosinicella flava TaxID=2771430 RepID=A0A7T2LMJ6_9SPHN|nr:hypothetical protein IC614_01650 [Sphingosinicella flava]
MKLEECQEALVHALDGDDIDALEQSIEALRHTVEAARGVGGWHDEPDLRDRAVRIQSLAQAAMMRVNFLTDLTRQRLETLSALRGRPAVHHYSGKR